jgi:hypothetical protein
MIALGERVAILGFCPFQHVSGREPTFQVPTIECRANFFHRQKWIIMPVVKWAKFPCRLWI